MGLFLGWFDLGVHVRTATQGAWLLRGHAMEYLGEQGALPVRGVARGVNGDWGIDMPFEWHSKHMSTTHYCSTTCSVSRHHVCSEVGENMVIFFNQRLAKLSVSLVRLEFQEQFSVNFF